MTSEISPVVSWVVSAILWILFGCGVAGLLVTLLGDRALRRTLRARTQPLRFIPPITVLKPVKGLDEGLVENLSSFFEQDYPDFELLIGAASGNDPALLLARELCDAYPHVRARVVVCPPDGGLNPKVSILRALCRYARTDLVLISDSNVRVGSNYLSTTARELSDPRVGLVTNPIVGMGEESVGALLEGHHLTTYVARALAFAAAYFRHACVVGKSMLFRLSDLERVGGWASVRDVLAEDYALGQAFERAGFRVASSPYIIRNYIRSWPIDRFVNRHMRWGQMRRRSSGAAYLLEPLTNPTAFFSLTIVGALAAGAPRPLVPLAAAGIATRLLIDWALLVHMRRAFVGLGFLLLGVPKDLLVLGLWVTAAFRRTIEWRGRRFLIGRGTRLESIPEPHAAAAPARVNEAA